MKNRSKFPIKIIVLCLICLSCTSCWGSSNIEDELYISAIGVDYDGEQYTLYAQIQNFQNIIEFKQRTNNKSAGAYVGIGKGKSIHEAALDLARTAQSKIEWGHVEAIVLSESAIQYNGISIPRKIYRYPDTRYNSWIYVSSSSMLELFFTGNIYDESSLSTTLFKPEESYKQRSSFKPLYTYEFVANYNEPDRTVVVPYIVINKDQWHSSTSALELLEINGGYFISKFGKQKFYSEEELEYYPLTLKKSRSRVGLMEDDKPIADFIFITDQRKVDITAIGNDVKFELNLSYSSAMYELLEEIPYNEIEQRLKDEVKTNIMKLYLQGVEDEVDILNLMPMLRYKYPELWKELTDSGQTFILDESSLSAINIKLTIPFNGKYKLKPEETN